MNIAVVGLDNKYVADFSKKLALKMKMNYVNFDEELEKDLLNTENYKLLNGEAEEKESLLIKNILQKENVLMSITNESFLSNENYNIFNNTFTILIEKQEDNKILKNIQKIIKKHCKIAIKQEKININEILNIIKG